MDISLSTQTPLSYVDWSNSIGSFAVASQEKYLSYLNNWYSFNSNLNYKNNLKKTTRDQYIQLIKDVSYLFNKDERDLFLSDIDYTKDEDLIYIIPYIVQKLKEISQIICAKREQLKYTNTKQSMIGTDQALEKILYEYVLKNFTKKEYSYTHVPISPLQNVFPELSAVNDGFFIEVEELYDTNTYFDSDPSVDVSKYVDITKLASYEPFADLSEDELMGLLVTRFLPKVSETPLSTIYNQYVQSFTTTASAVSGFASSQLYNRIAANQKYLSENVYALTAVKNSEVNNPDFVLNLSFQQGNNWFYWPSGDKITDVDTIGNIYKAIPINQSNLVLNRTVTGSSYFDSDLFFTDKNGTIEGAWLQGDRIEKSYDKISLHINAGEKRYFIYPFVGFNIDPKSFEFSGYSLNDDNNEIFNSLYKDTKQKVLTEYYNGTLPVSASFDIYLNQTNLLSAGAYAGYFSDQGDTIIKKASAQNFKDFSDYLYGDVEGAFLYKYDYTEIYVGSGDNDIIWPLGTYNAATSLIPITINQETCLPIPLNEIDPRHSMVGSIAGTDFQSADVIYKMQSRGGTDAIEAAWLGTGNISQLDIIKNAIQVYSTSAVNCADYIDGPILSSLSLLINPGDKVSFVWMDRDTPADEVFSFKQHAAGCPFGKTFPHDFYENQDYLNNNPLNGAEDFPLTKNPCTCRSVYYSPIGCQGNSPSDYNGIMDYLFADPQGVGSNLNLKTWVDTRNFNAFNSPQFAFYKLDGTLDQEVGFGTGKWQTGDGQPMILKTGRRYTYSRTNLRKTSSNAAVVPYLLVNYPYKQITVNCPKGYTNQTDLVVLLDHSRTETRSVDFIKNIASDLCSKILSNNADVKLSLISFAFKPEVKNYLNNSLGLILQNIASIQPYRNAVADYPAFLTDIYSALNSANDVLFNNKPYDNICDENDVTALCNNVSTQIIDNSGVALRDSNGVTLELNCPRKNAAKKIVIISDGQETVNIDKAVPYAKTLKDKGVEITCMDIGLFSPDNQVMEQMASDGHYYDLQKLSSMTDFDEYSLNQYISLRLIGCFPAVPTWCKAIKTAGGVWVSSNEPTDMILNPGDYIVYNHQSSANYTTQNNNNFSVNAISFTINKKLNGWDYDTNSFSLSAIGDSYGAKPYWGKMYAKDETDFVKKTLYFGGQIRFLNGYVPVHQPVVSDMKLSNGGFFEYTSRGNKNLNWIQPVSFNVHLTSQQWNKLIVSEDFSNLSFALQTNNLLDLITDYTYEPSDIVLESYSQFSPALYNLYLRNPSFIYNENLYYLNSCSESYYIFTSGVVLSVSEPYMNLENVHYPSVATVDFPSNMVSKNKINFYMTPDKLGVSFYRGKGYSINLDPNSLSYVNSISAERLFLDINKYGPRNRGLTKKDQISPVVISDIDNRWIYEPFTSSSMAGKIRDTVQNQKMTPYMSNFESDLYNNIGLSLQNDNFNFWNVDYNNEWNDNKNYPLTLRKEIATSSYNKRIETLLVNKGTLTEWKTDIYGNNFGLFKN